MSSPDAALVFDPPGHGHWSLDTGRFPHPVTALTAETFPGPALAGFAAATAPYGLLLEFVEWRFVHGWAYLSPRPVRSLEEAGALSRRDWQERVATDRDLAGRLATSGSVFRRRPWRGELARWEQRIKPDLMASHRSIQAESPATMAAADLRQHLERCQRALGRAIRLHHRFNVTPVVPVGDLLAHAGRWTGAPLHSVLELLPVADRVTSGTSGELAALAEALCDDPTASKDLAVPPGEARDALDRLRARPGPAGRAATAYLDLVGQWSAGSGTDITEPRLLEVPGVLLGLIRAAADRHRAGTVRSGAASGIRAAVPASLRQQFDELLGEARAVHALRHERAVYTGVWANGLMRRAVTAAGRRLADRGVLDEPAHLLEARYPEVQALVGGHDGPPASELSRRARERAAVAAVQPPETLGGPPRSPVPIAWLPDGPARTERAFRTYLAALSEPEPDAEGAHDPVLRGIGASDGVHQGPARIVSGAADLDRIGPGDVLVTGVLTPALSAILPLVGAVVTERGGALSHAAIVARERGLPAVVGAAGATRRIRDGGQVRVDGGAGTVVPADG